jgi:hypothetical protein
MELSRNVGIVGQQFAAPDSGIEFDGNRATGSGVNQYPSGTGTAS